ncbi:Type II secretion system (T2SS), protein F [uncultured archaeon]|nr:Type II secretion system (T2SS), protein F [uncultured archaeon]
MALPDFFSRRDAEIESGLPHTLRLLSAELEVGVPFESALSEASAGDPAFGGELSRVAREASNGSPLHSALSRASARTNSLQAKRAYAAIARCYSGEDSASSLKALASEFARMGRLKLKEHASRSSMLGIAFISASCVLPSLLLSFSVIGSSFMGEVMSGETLWLLFGFVLPAILLSLILAAWLSSPELSARHGPAFLSGSEREIVGRYLLNHGIKFSKAVSAAAAAALIVFAFLALHSFGNSSALSLVAAASILLSPLAAYTFFAHLASLRARGAERFLPDALLHASSLSSCASFEAAAKSISKSGYGALGEEFAAASKRMEAGEPFPEAMEGISARLDSRLVSRATGLLSRAYETGADLGEAMREAADDAVEVFSSEKEKAALLSLQRYTLLAGVLLVPIILGMVCGAVSGIGSSIADLGSGTFLEPSGTLLPEGLRAATAYLAIFSVSSALFIAVQEGEPKKAAAYAALFLPVTLAFFSLASGFLPA